MKKLLLLSNLIMLYTLSLFSQDIDWSYMHGIKSDKGQIGIELSGYNIYILQEKGQINKPKDISKITKKYKIKTITKEYSYPDIEEQNVVVEGVSDMDNRDSMKVNQICFMLPAGEKKIKAILMQTINERDTVLEHSFVKAYLNKELDGYIFPDQKADTVSFAGRDIYLGSACGWRGPHNIYCRGGQISWSEFSTFEAAEADINARIAANTSEKLMILYEEDLDVVFEEIPSLAHRVVYQENPRSHYFYYNVRPLIVYYIVQEVRGRFVSCVMSNYGYNKNDYELSPLLQEVMSIPEIPDSAYNKFDVPIPDEEYVEAVTKQYSIPIFEIRSGIWQPMGKLRNVYKFAPSVELFMGIPIKRDMTIDLGIQLAFPTNRKEFDFYYGNDIYAVKTNLIGSINVRWRYEQELKKNIYFSNYIGTGVGVLQTNLEKDDSKDDSAYHSVETFDIFGGVGLRYKWIGAFAEYHFLPYSIAGKVRQSLGNSVINTGISFSF